MSDDSNYDRMQAKRDEYMKHYELEQERKERAERAHKAANAPSRPYTHTSVEYEKTTFAKLLRIIGFIALLGSLAWLYFFPDSAKASDNTSFIGGGGLFLILLPSVGHWLGKALAVFLVINLFLATGLGFAEYALSAVGIVFGLSVKRLLWKEKSRETYTVR